MDKNELKMYNEPLDKKYKEVRFLYKDIDDIEKYHVHQIDIDGKKRYVLCKHYENKRCPLCDAGYECFYKAFIRFKSDIDEDFIIWVKDAKFLDDIKKDLKGYKGYLSDNIVRIIHIDGRNKHLFLNRNDEKFALKINEYKPIDKLEVPRKSAKEILIVPTTMKQLDYYAKHKKFEEKIENEFVYMNKKK